MDAEGFSDFERGTFLPLRVDDGDGRSEVDPDGAINAAEVFLRFPVGKNFTLHFQAVGAIGQLEKNGEPPSFVSRRLKFGREVTALGAEKRRKRGAGEKEEEKKEKRALRGAHP